MERKLSELAILFFHITKVNLTGSVAKWSWITFISYFGNSLWTIAPVDWGRLV